jgi:hypothetical protein
MSEGPEVKHTADKIVEAILAQITIDVRGKTIEQEQNLKEKIIGSKVLSVILMAKISLSASQVVYFCVITW